ncbi:MAG: hypothetical protein PHI35_01560 [Victivallaceae bacterium]|nr:hypothetical protein [Victivallaceae bacterium]
MRKVLFLATAMFLSCAVSAMDWDFLSFGVTEDFPSDSAEIPICGVKIGVPICGGNAPVYGVEAAIFYAATKEVEGLKCSLIATNCKETEGMQFALVNFADKTDGLQLGIFNSAKHEAFQIGLLNHIEDAMIPWLPIVNFNFD